MQVLTQERMRVNVELCARLLVVARRVAPAQRRRVPPRAHWPARRDQHAPSLGLPGAPPVHLQPREHTQVLSTIDAENARADKTSQAMHTLRYEAEKFRIPDLHTAMPPRQKVLELRKKVFAMGRRRLPPGVRGAHGRFNRQVSTNSTVLKHPFTPSQCPKGTFMRNIPEL